MSQVFNGGVAEKRISLNRFLQVTATNAAKMFGLFPKKGTIAVGSDADIVIFDPEREETVSINNPLMYHMRVSYSLRGVPDQGLLRDRVEPRKDHRRQGPVER